MFLILYDLEKNIWLLWLYGLNIGKSKKPYGFYDFMAEFLILVTFLKKAITFGAPARMLIHGFKIYELILAI